MANALRVLAMDAVQKAWFLSVMNDTKELRSLQEYAAGDQQRLVSMIMLIRLLEERDNLLILENPLLVRSLDSVDPSVQSLAKWIKRRAEGLLETELAKDSIPPG